MTPNFYQTITETAIAEYKDRGSKFIGYAIPLQTVADFKIKMQWLKKEHPKADHFCFAYRIGVDKLTYRVSDAGEPSGTAGKPILGQIDSKGVTNILVVVVRYFGGTLLGVPGLINAYKTTASFAIQTVPLVQKELVQTYQLQFDYTLMNEVQKIIKQNRGTITHTESMLFNLLTTEVPLAEAATFELQINRISVIEMLKK